MVLDVPVVFALGRVALGRACSKPSPVSSVAIISPAGAEEKFKQSVELAQRAHESYIELVKMAVAEQIEQREQSAKAAAQAEKGLSTHAGGSAHVQFSASAHHHMGHTRNASNISAISFISNVSAMSDNNSNLPNDTAEENNLELSGSEKDELEDVEDDFEDEEEEEDEPQKNAAATASNTV